MPLKPTIMTDPLTNRGTAFTREERIRLGLVGRLPSAVESLDQQAARTYAQLRSYGSDLQRYVFLDQLHDRNEVLYYRVLTDHLSELLPVVYDPTIGEAIKQWSRDYRRSRAVYLSIDRIDDIGASFDGLGLGPDDVDLIVCSDAEEILGIGDWGVNGTDISIGKLAVYTAAAGIDPARTIAVNLDCGTNNEALLNDPAYLGNRHSRVRGERYDEFIAAYLGVASRRFPGALLHFEDFGPSNARRILVDNADDYRIFNDDMQGTGAIVVAAVISGMKVTGQTFADQRLVVYGAGTAGTGMADQIRAGMVRAGRRVPGRPHPPRGLPAAGCREPAGLLRHRGRGRGGAGRAGRRRHRRARRSRPGGSGRHVAAGLRAAGPRLSPRGTPRRADRDARGPAGAARENRHASGRGRSTPSRTHTSSSWTTPSPPHSACGQPKAPVTRHSPAIQPIMTRPARAWARTNRREPRSWSQSAAHWKPPTTTPRRTAASPWRPAAAVPSSRGANHCGTSSSSTKPMSVERH